MLNNNFDLNQTIVHLLNEKQKYMQMKYVFTRMVYLHVLILINGDIHFNKPLISDKKQRADIYYTMKM